MNLIMVTPRVGASNPLLAFIPTWVTHLARRVDRLWVVTPRAEIVPLPDNVIVHEVGRDYSKGETILHALRRFHHIMWRLTHDEQVDGIFTHMYPKFALLSAPYARSKWIPLVMWYTHKSVSWQLRLASLMVDRILTVSAETCRLDSPKVQPVGHGIDTEVFRKRTQCSVSDEQGQMVLTVGRISPIKNLEVLIEAANILVNQQGVKDLKFVLVGAPPNKKQRRYQERLQRLVSTCGLEQHVAFMGKIPHARVLDLYQKCDVFASACNSGVDKAILEAMACEVPVVISNPVFQPMLGEYANDLMYRPGDATALAEQLAKILTMPADKRRSLGQALRTVVQSSHNVEDLMGKLVRMFEVL